MTVDNQEILCKNCGEYQIPKIIVIERADLSYGEVLVCKTVENESFMEFCHNELLRTF